MGLIGISTPQPIGEDLIHNKFVVVGHTETKTIKLYYKIMDSVELLKELMLANEIEESVASEVLKTTDMFANSESNGDSPNDLASKLPGVHNEVKHPVTGKINKLFHVVIDLNDHHAWTREAIADWIENVCDIKDITFQAPEEVKSEKGILSDFAKVVTIESVL